MELRDGRRPLDSLSRAGELRLPRRQGDPLHASRTHERLDQFHEGVRFVAGDVTRQADNRLSESLFGTIHEGITLDPAPALTPDHAGRRISRSAAAELPAGSEPERVVGRQ
jgi:hypothetical protein